MAIERESRTGAHNDQMLIVAITTGNSLKTVDAYLTNRCSNGRNRRPSSASRPTSQARGSRPLSEELGIGEKK